MAEPVVRPSVLPSAVAIGAGMGGFVDGIVFHQILQLHNMLSAWLPTTTLVAAKVNMVWDGLFHAGMWLLTAAGIGLLWRAARRPGANLDGRIFTGGLLLGWGLFNLIEGVIDHHLLQAHHVVERAGLSGWDYAFLGWGAAMAMGGWSLVRAGRRGTP